MSPRAACSLHMIDVPAAHALGAVTFSAGLGLSADAHRLIPVGSLVGSAATPAMCRVAALRYPPGLSTTRPHQEIRRRPAP